MRLCGMFETAVERIYSCVRCHASRHPRICRELWDNGSRPLGYLDFLVGTCKLPSCFLANVWSPPISESGSAGGIVCSCVSACSCMFSAARNHTKLGIRSCSISTHVYISQGSLGLCVVVRMAYNAQEERQPTINPSYRHAQFQTLCKETP